MSDRERDLKPRWRLVHDLNVEALDAQVAALRAALDGAKVCGRCHGDGWYVVDRGTEQPEQQQCEQCQCSGVERDDVPADAGREWLADARAVTAALVRAQWGSDEDTQNCPVCDWQKPYGHEPGCAIGDSLAWAEAQGWVEAT